MKILSLFLVLLVVGSSAAVIFLFFKRLNAIETELWGQKKQEAEKTAAELRVDTMTEEPEE